MTRLIDAMIERTGRAIAWLAGLMVFVTVVVVVLRYGFDVGAIALQESVTYLHALLFLFGLSYTLKADAHVRVDLFYGRMSERARLWVNLVGHVTCLVPTALVVLVLGSRYAAKSWSILEASPEVGGIPAVFLLKTFIPLGAGLLLLQAVAEIARCLGGLRGSDAGNG